MDNPIFEYMQREEIGCVEMAKRLGGISKGYASLLSAGKKPITPGVARRLAKLTGEPWWKFLPEDDSDSDKQAAQ